MPANSESQRKLFSIALDIRRNGTPGGDVSKKALDIANSDMSTDKIEEFAKKTIIENVGKFEKINSGEVDAALRSRLQARHIPHNVFYMDDDQTIIIVYLKGKSFSVILSYILYKDTNGYVISSTDNTITGNNLISVISGMVLDLRRTEIRFSKLRKK